jgi:hypothetical protein
VEGRHPLGIRKTPELASLSNEQLKKLKLEQELGVNLLAYKYRAVENRHSQSAFLLAALSIHKLFRKTSKPLTLHV